MYARAFLALLILGSRLIADDAADPSFQDVLEVARRPVRIGGDRSADERHDHADRPTVPQSQSPLPSTPRNIDTGRSILDWQHATDDWAGWRPWLDDRGIVLDSSLTVDLSRSFRGGIKTSQTISRHLFDLNLTLDTDRLFDLRGGTVFFDVQSFDGTTGEVIVGDFQVFSNIDAQPMTQVSGAWYQHVWQDDTLRLKIGRVDANSEFAYVNYGAEFLNSSMGFSPTIFVMPTYPDQAVSVNLFWEPSDRFDFGIGTYFQTGPRSVPRGSRLRSLLTERLFLIAEAGIQWSTEDGVLPGRFGVGGWYHNGDFERFDGRMQKGTGGLYLMLDQLIIREKPSLDDDHQGVGFFAQYGNADREVSESTMYLGCGLAWRGAIPSRDEDTLGMGVSWIDFSDLAPGIGLNAETTTELFYRVTTTKWAEITFDLQYIRHPGGVIGRSDSLVGTSRFVIHF